MKQPIGFNGNALWPIVILLIVGVAWIQEHAGFTAAGYALIAVGGALFIIVGFLLALASKQMTMNGLIGFKQAEAQIERERERNRREELKGDNRLEARAMQVGTAIARQMFSYWQATKNAQSAAEQAERVAQQDASNPYIIDLSKVRVVDNEDDL